MTWAVKMADARYDGYDEGFEKGVSVGLTTGREEGISIGLERGAYETKLETAKAMLLNGITIPLIVDCTNLPLETVLELVQST